MAALFRVGVAVEARHLQIARVQPMGKGDGLDRLVALMVAGQMRRPQPRDQGQQAHGQTGQQHGCVVTRPAVRTWPSSTSAAISGRTTRVNGRNTTSTQGVAEMQLDQMRQLRDRAEVRLESHKGAQVGQHRGRRTRTSPTGRTGPRQSPLPTCSSSRTYRIHVREADALTRLGTEQAAADRQQHPRQCHQGEDQSADFQDVRRSGSLFHSRICSGIRKASRWPARITRIP